MINSYSLHYCYKTIGDVLLINIDSHKIANRHEKKGDVVAIYQDDELIGINIFNISKIIKIKNQGMIFLPTKALLDVINPMLKNVDLPELELQEKSGYTIGEISEIFEVANGFLYVINIKGEIVYALGKNNNLENGNKVVVATLNSKLSNGEIVKERSGDFGFTNAHLCSYFDLGIENKEDILVVEDDTPVGEDFFLLEEK